MSTSKKLSPQIESSIVEAVKEAVTTEMTGKKWYTSKTVWVNVITLLAAGAQSVWGVAFPVEYQMIVLSVINLGLRQITHEQINW